MEWRRVKNIIILILLLVNGFLLVFVGVRMSEVRRYEKSAMEQAVQVLEGKGIRTSVEQLASADALFPQSAERSVATEEKLAAGLLGEAVAGQNMGGGLYTYEGSCGTVSFRPGGVMAAVLHEDARWHSDDPGGTVWQLLSSMELEGALLSDTVVNGTGAVTIHQIWQEVPVFSCQLVFTYEEGRLVTVSGTVLAIAEGVAEADDLLNLPTALMQFLDEILSSGDICSEILSMQPGYRVSQSFSSAVHLEPVWLISSNTADYYMDAVTGALSRITGESGF